MKLSDLPTPCALVDLDRVERNCRRMKARIEQLGARLRPHVKTHKCPELARLQCGGEVGPITVSTLAEAEAFADAGFVDITLAVPIAPSRLRRAAALDARIERLHILLDDVETCDAAAATARGLGARYSVFLKVDCGYHRAGVDPRSPSALALAQRIVETQELELAGLLTHAGHSYDQRGAEAIALVAEQERAAVVGFAARLRAAGIEPGVVSAGSTPTATRTRSLEGVDEMRPGNYVFFDLHQSGIGSCTEDDIALTVLTTVIGSYPERRSALIDAGALAMSKDPGPSHLESHEGYGRVTAADGAASPRPLKLTGLSQEHGKLGFGAPADAPAAGALLRVLPNHSCLTAALHPELFLIRGEDVVGSLRPTRGW